MDIKSYYVGYYISTNNNIKVWTIDEHIFFELNSKGWKSLIAESFEEYFNPKGNFSDEVEEIQIDLENKRIVNKIKNFLIHHVETKKSKKIN